MAAAVTTDPSGSFSLSGKVDIAPLRRLPVTAALNQALSSSAPIPTSASSPSNGSTPATSSSSSSTAPPIAIRPTAAGIQPPIKASAAMSGVASPTTASPASVPQPPALTMTSKEWVIPPRPKPGRKPATDTPPTKRKAQNRAAQRAFRERRAARVGELEEQLEEEKAAHERAVQELQDRISHLEIETQTLQSRCQWLESMLEKERQGRDRTASNWDSPQPLGTARSDSLLSTQTQQPQPIPAGEPQSMRSLQPAPPGDAVAPSIAIAEPRPVAQRFSISQIISPPEEAPGTVGLTCGGCEANGACACAEEALRNTDLPLGCGKCSLGTRCECLEESFKVSMAVPDLKRRPRSPPSNNPEGKRQRSDAGLAVETDFTTLFASRANKQSAQSTSPLPAEPQVQPPAALEPKDACGFCEEGTYCVCADSMMAPTSIAARQREQIAEQTQTRTPPPSENDVVPLPMEVTATGAIKLPGVRALQQDPTTNPPQSLPPPRTGGCGPNGPGTCAQCLADPKSGLFCRSLAANFEKNNTNTSNSGCCGNGGPGGCCKTGQARGEATSVNTSLLGGTTATRTTAATTSTVFGLSLSCADAYKTLASHRHFDEAADDIGSWLPKLRALPIPRTSDRTGGRGLAAAGGGRAPIEVEAASIMSVLKDFDIRFGRGE